MKTQTENLARYAAHLARLSRMLRTFKVRPGSRKVNTEQEDARRRRFYEKHGTAIGGGPIWPG